MQCDNTQSRPAYPLELYIPVAGFVLREISKQVVSKNDETFTVRFRVASGNDISTWDI